VDHFLSSLARSRKHRAIGVILSGTASDGTAGLREIKGEGGITFAQEQSSAKFDGMPRSAIAAGVVDFVLRPQDIGRELVRISRHSYLVTALGDHAPPPSAGGTDDLNKVFRCYGRIRARIFPITNEAPSSGDCDGAWRS